MLKQVLFKDLEKKYGLSKEVEVDENFGFEILDVEETLREIENSKKEKEIAKIAKETSIANAKEPTDEQNINKIIAEQLAKINGDNQSEQEVKKEQFNLSTFMAEEPLDINNTQEPLEDTVEKLEEVLPEEDQSEK